MCMTWICGSCDPWVFPQFYPWLLTSYPHSCYALPYISLSESKGSQYSGLVANALTSTALHGQAAWTAGDTAEPLQQPRCWKHPPPNTGNNPPNAMLVDNLITLVVEAPAPNNGNNPPNNKVTLLQAILDKMPTQLLPMPNGDQTIDHLDRCIRAEMLNAFRFGYQNWIWTGAGPDFNRRGPDCRSRSRGIWRLVSLGLHQYNNYYSRI